MRILLVQDADWTKKGPHQQHHLMERLSLKGHEIQVIGFDQLWDGKGFFSKKLISKDVERFYKGAKITFIKPMFIKRKILDYISFILFSRKEIMKSIEEFRPDIVIGVTSVISNYWGMYYARKNNIPFIYYWTDVIHMLIPFKILRPIAKYIIRKIINNSSSILTINEVLKDYVIEFGAYDKITDVIPGGVDFGRFNPDKVDSTYFREKYGISDDELLLFFMGWIYDFSGLKEVALELSKIKKVYPKIKLLIVGNGDGYDEIKDVIASNNLEDNVIMTGQMPYEDIPRLIASADICLLPAYNNKIMKDIVPIKIYEYLAMQKPVITTKLPGVMKEFGNDGVLTYVNKPEDVVETAINLNKKDKKLTRSKIKKFIENYEWNIIMDQFENKLESQIRISK